MSVFRRSTTRPLIAIAASLAILALILLACEPSTKNKEISSLSSEQMLEDYDYLVDFLRDNYVFFDVFHNKTGVDWLEHAAEERKAILPTITPQQFFELVYELVAIFDDHHAKIVHPHAWEGHRRSITLALNSGHIGPSKRIRCEPLFDATINEKYAQWKELIGDDSTKQKNGAPTPGVRTKVIDENRIAYIGISSFSQTRVASERDTLAAFYEKIIDYPYLIIDITENGGGSDLYWIDNIVRPLITAETISHRYLLLRDSAFIRGLLDISELSSIADLPSELNPGKYNFARYFSFFSNQPTILQPDDTVGFEGQIIIMTSDITASAANNFAMFAKHSGWATLAGGPTHGDGTGNAYVGLPNSGLVLRIDMALVLNNDGSINLEVGTQPDVMIDGEDQLERVIEYINRDRQQSHGVGK